MGTESSQCCSSCRPSKEFESTTSNKELKKQRNKQLRNTDARDPLLSGDTSAFKQGEVAKRRRSDSDDVDYLNITSKLECVTKKDLEKCQPLQRVITVIQKYNEWLKDNKFSDRKKLRSLDIESIDYTKYETQIEDLIEGSQQQYSLKSFLSDTLHIKHFHHYQYTEMRKVIMANMQKKDKFCTDDNCFSMKHYFLRKQTKLKPGHRYNRLHDPLEILTNLHVFMFHAIYISEFKIQHVHPRNAYLTATYIERQQRELNIIIYQNQRDEKSADKDLMPINIVHLCALYYGGKYIEDDDTLDKVSPLALSEFIEKTMNKATLGKVWKKLDEDGSNTIDKDEVDGILLLTVILLVATDFKDSGVTGSPKIDKSELRELMRPIGAWMKRDKLIEQPVITKAEFQETFSKWLKEYHETNGGIIADPKQQLKILQKYHVTDKKNGLLDAFKSKEKDHDDRLVVNCEYLRESVVHDDDDGDSSRLSLASSGGSSLNPDAKST